MSTSVWSPPAAGLDPSECVFRNVSKTARAVAALYDAAFDPLDLTAGQVNALITIGRLGRANMGVIARQIGLDPTSLTRLLEPLRKSGLVAFEVGEDRRMRMVRLTPAGRRKLNAAYKAWSSIQQRLVDAMPQGLWPQAICSLSAIRSAAREPFGAR